MDVTISRVNRHVHFEATNADGQTLHMDGAAELGGTKAGFRPMELLLAGMGGCSAIDVVELLQEQGQPLEDLRIRVSANRAADRIPRVFTAIHLHYTLYGKLDRAVVEQALERGILKQCSVGEMLGRTAAITYDYTIEPT